MGNAQAPETRNPGDIPCVDCGYDLRGLDESGRCPECETPIARSLGGNRLANANPAWVAGIARGQRLATLGLAASMIGFVSSIIIAILIGLAASIMNWTAIGLAVEICVRVLIIGVGLGGLAVASFGCFLVTAPDPRDTGREPVLTARDLARGGLIVAIVLLAITESGSVSAAGLPAIIADTLTFAGLIACTIAISALLHRLSALAWRIPNQPLALAAGSQGRQIAWILAAFAVVLFMRRASPAALLPAQVANWLDQALQLAAVILFIVLIVGITRVFRTMKGLSRAFAEVRDAAVNLTPPPAEAPGSFPNPQ